MSNWTINFASEQYSWLNTMFLVAKAWNLVQWMKVSFKIGSRYGLESGYDVLNKLSTSNLSSQKLDFLLYKYCNN